MKHLSVALGLGILALALLVGVAETQDKKDAGKAKGLLPPGWKNLDLSATQREAIYKVQNDYKSKYAELNRQLKELQAKERGEMTKILTDEQKAQLVKFTTGDTGEAKKKPDNK
jgi:Spy/CpxP family protein refolding chaperone